MTDVPPHPDLPSDEVPGAAEADRALLLRRAAARLLVHRLNSDREGLVEVFSTQVLDEGLTLADIAFPLLDLVVDYLDPIEATTRAKFEIVEITRQLEDGR